MKKTNIIFKSIEEPKKSGRKWIFFPVSLLFHGLLLASIILVPLLQAIDELPPVIITKVVVIAPPTAPPPPPAPPKKRAGTKIRK
ncbi:MAG: hypothetical protein GY765_38170, partial [bacterium]|nr:hypothetical protein [bacterium]